MDLVEMMGARAGQPGRFLPLVYEKSTGTYFAPSEPVPPDFRRLFDMGFNGRNTVVAVLDTGLLVEHPWIKSRLIESVDFTREGMTDQSGHGTLVALQLIRFAPGSRLINVKVLDGRGYGDETWLIKALDWCVEWRKRNAQYPIMSLNLSLGIYHDNCDGSCRLSQAAERVRQAGIMIAAAAGNEGPNRVPCPQKYGLEHKRFSVVAALDLETGSLATYSGKGSTAAPEASAKMAPVSDLPDPATPGSA